MKTFSKLMVLTAAVFLLTACGGNKDWQVEVDLTPQERTNIEKAITDWQQQIDAFVIDETGEIAWRQIIELALAYEKIGRFDKAIGIYNEWFDKGYKTLAMINNVGRLYEKVDEYDLAIVAYQRIVDEYMFARYYYDITWAYIRAGDRLAAEKAFNTWQRETNKTDEQTQQKLKKMREEEKEI